MYVLPVPLIAGQRVRAGGIFLDAAVCCIGGKVVGGRRVVCAGAREPEAPAMDVSNGVADDGVGSVEVSPLAPISQSVIRIPVSGACENPVMLLPMIELKPPWFTSIPAHVHVVTPLTQPVRRIVVLLTWI